MDEFFDALSGFIGLILLVAVVAVVMALPVMWCWNWVMPDIFDLQTITFWQALGLSMLSSFLFKSSSSSKKA